MGKPFPFQTGYEPQYVFEEGGELWSTVPGSVGYLVSSTGKVIGRRGKLMTGSDNGRGYRQVLMYDRNNKMKSMKIHRLVAHLFLPNWDDKFTVNHKDFDKYNNNVDNLEWASNSENHRHKCEAGRNVALGGEKHWNARLTTEQAREIFLAEGTYKEIANNYGIKSVTVCAIKKRRIRRKETEDLL